MSFRAASILVALTGFTALGYELVWVRVYYFLSATMAMAFACLLCSYLLGLALGSLWSLRLQQRLGDAPAPEQSAGVARLVLRANIAGYLVAPAVSWIAALRVLPAFQNGPAPWYFTYPLVSAAAGWLGTLLPLICHFSVPPDARVGLRLSQLYLANILGAGAGSLLTGFVLMEYLPLRWISFLLLALGVVIYIVLSGSTRRSFWRGAAVIAAGAGLTPALYWHFWERMLRDHAEWGPGHQFAVVVESRSGVITVDKSNRIYGGGSYDGVVDISPVNWPWLVRAYALPAIHPHPEEVLMIGLGGGAWAQITAANPHVRHVTCVEINHSYTDVIAQYPAVASLLTNPKVEIIIDDGRRWLERNPGRKFDAILMNTTQHWREYASNLLSREFLHLAARHLKTGAVFQYNATDSLRVQQTALDTFGNVMLLLNNVIVWNGPVQWNSGRWKSVLESYRIDGRPVFDPRRPQDREVLARMLALGDTPGKEPADLAGNPLWKTEADREDFRLRSRAQIEKACREAGAEPITDDNLGHEFQWWR
jgi:hypothetical protein